MTKQKWNSFTINLGKPGDVSLERRGAYEAAALAAGTNLSRWAREILDRESEFKEKQDETPLPKL